MAITLDSTGVGYRREDGTPAHLAWADLRAVWVMTTDDGPFAPDFFFVLLGPGDTHVTIADEVPTGPDLLARLQDLPGFDNEAFIAATASTDNARWLVWRSAEC
jgi:hypothetical protein